MSAAHQDQAFSRDHPKLEAHLGKTKIVGLSDCPCQPKAKEFMAGAQQD